MSCEFCNKFDFTSVAVKDNNICGAGGSSRFTDAAYDNRPEFQLFNYCPICGAKLFYYETAEKTDTNIKPVVVAVDDMGQRIPFAIYDSDTVMSEEAYCTISDLRVDAGCSFKLAKKAYEYVTKYGGGYSQMLFYCQALDTCKSLHESVGFFHTLTKKEKVED